jgi:hypothetical protein
MRKTMMIVVLMVLTVSGFYIYNTANISKELADEITVVNNRDSLLLYLSLGEGFEKKIIDTIKSGVETSFTFTITTERIRPAWFNKKVNETGTTNTIKFDSLKNRYMVSKLHSKDNPVITDNLETAIKEVKKIEGLGLISMDRLAKGTRYRIRVKAELANYSLPYYLDYILFFLSFNDYETKWYSVDFIY